MTSRLQRLLRSRPEAEIPLAEAKKTRVAVGITGLCAAVTLVWSLHLKPGDALFYPATLLVAAIYLLGSALTARIGRSSLPWRSSRQEIATAFGAGLALAVMFFVGAFLVRYIAFLRDPVNDLLDHARRGNLALVALTTAVNGVAEEVFYRGALWQVIPPRWRILGTTALYTAVTAAVGIPLLALAAAALGVFVACLREYFRSLTSPIIMHLTWSLLMLFVLPSIVR